MSKELKNETALVTGATSGMGYELAKLLAADGYNLVIVARTEDNLARVAGELQNEYGVKVETIQKDLFEAAAADELYEEIKRRNITVDILVNDAGQGVFGLFVDRTIEDQVKIIHLNIISLTRLTYFILKDMLARNKGKIMQLASMLSEVPAPYNAVYAATKAYVLAFTEGIISETQDSEVTITALMPPATKTDFWRKADALQSKDWVGGKLADPKVVAKDGYEGMMKGVDKVLSGIGNKIMMAVTNVIPDTVLADHLKEQSAPVDKPEN